VEGGSGGVCVVEVRVGSLMDTADDEGRGVGVELEGGGALEEALSGVRGGATGGQGGSAGVSAKGRRWSRKVWVSVAVHNVARGPRTLGVVLRSGADLVVGDDGEEKVERSFVCDSEGGEGSKASVKVHVGGLVDRAEDPFSLPGMSRFVFWA
jgi:hypothetical protein